MLDRGLDVDPCALLHRAILLLVPTGDRPRLFTTRLMPPGQPGKVQVLGLLALLAWERSGPPNGSALVLGAVRPEQPRTPTAAAAGFNPSCERSLRVQHVLSGLLDLSRSRAITD